MEQTSFSSSYYYYSINDFFDVNYNEVFID